MADHTLWGTSPPPWTANKASDGDPSIRTGSAIYSTATTLWVKGARIYVPAGHGLAGTATLALRVYDYESAPDFSTTPLRTVVVTIESGAGWYQDQWTGAVELAPTDVAWITVEDLGVNYIWSTVGDNLPHQAADAFDLFLAENDTQWRGGFQSPAQTGSTLSSGFYFNTDGIFGTAAPVDITADAPLATGVGQAHAPEVSVGVTVSAPLMTAVATPSAPEVSAGVTVTAPPMTGLGEVFAPSLSAGVTVSPPVASGAGLASAPTVSVVAFIVVAVPVMTGQGAMPNPNAFIALDALNLPEVLTLTVVPIPKVEVVPYDRTLTVVEN